MTYKDIQVSIDGIHCANCVLNIENTLNKLNGVGKVNVNLSNIAEISYDPEKIDLGTINNAIESIGFEIKKDKLRIKIAKMHCAVCANNIEKGLSNLDGIYQVNVNLANEMADVLYLKSIVSIEDIKRTIEDLGFEVIETDAKVNDLDDKKNRIIVGFSFSAILMLLMYIHLPFHHLLNLVIAIIPFLYVSQPILKVAYKSIIHKQLNMDVMYSMGILVAFISSVLGTFNILLDSSFMFYETAIMLSSFLLLGRYLEGKAKKRTNNAIRKLIGLQAKTANLLVDENGYKIKEYGTYKEKEVLIEDIEVNDLLIVKPGGKIPVDGIVILGNSYVDQSMITGEPIPKNKTLNNEVFGGTINQDGTLYIKAIKVGKDTVLSQVIELTEKASSLKPPSANLANKVVKYFIPTIIIIAISSFIIWYVIFSESLLFSITTLISILVVACPCALGLATPTAVTVGIGRLSQYGILVKNGEVLENFKDLTMAVFDKTGTITIGSPMIEDVYPNEKRYEILQYAASIEKNSTHPIAKSINKIAEKEDIALLNIESFKNISGLGLKAIANSHKVSIGNKSLMDNQKIAINSDFEKKYLEFINEGKTTILVAIEDEVIGILTLTDKIKENSKKTIEKLKSMGIETTILTGDNENSAMLVGEKIAIDNVISEVLPNEKLDRIVSMQKKGDNVLFVGDGINDAPAITGANIGIALGTGTDIATESGDIVIIDGDLENVIVAIEISKKIIRRIKENIFWAFIYNIILIPIAAGILYPYFGIIFKPEFAGLAMALSSLTVISLSLMLRNYIPPIKKIAI
ncbi:MAG: heavy metal translocating P-type ATPase [Methanobrevibacter sp.]|jgi:Cu+-exporting ATPase|nr:heavy metal translocating P-type ATPase [Candidatus Methanovirga meridionalis]